MTKEVSVLLHNIRSTHNVGSIFRTADALGINKIYLSGYTPLPLDRFKRPRKDIAKVALGAEKNIPWEYIENPRSLIKKLKSQKYQIVSIEQDKKSKDYKKIKAPKPVLFLMGNEVTGVESDLLKLSDLIVEIPMNGKKESLNVSVAFAVALFRILNR